MSQLSSLKLFILLCLPLALLLNGCGKEKNPILGEWKVSDIKTGSMAVNTVTAILTSIKSPSVTFSETTLSYLNIGTNSATVNVTYRHDDDGTWFYCTESGRLCERFVFTDKERTKATTTLLGIEIVLTKVIPTEN